MELTEEQIENLSAKECTCPICNSENIEYGSAEIDSDVLFYPCVCHNCHATFNECYDLHFTGHSNIVDDDNNIEWISK